MGIQFLLHDSDCQFSCAGIKQSGTETLVISSSYMSDGAEVPWPESIWVQSDVQTLRDLYDNSVYHDSPTATFHLMMTPLRAILVPCGAWLSHPDIVRGFDEAEKLRKILLSHQKNQTASETSVSAPAHTASLAGGSAKSGPAPSACGDTLSIARNQIALEPSEWAPAHAAPLAGGSAKSGPAASACSDTLSIARNKKKHCSARKLCHDIRMKVSKTKLHQRENLLIF